MFWLLIILVLLLLFYYFLIKPQRYWSDRNVKQGFPIPLLGSNFKSIIGQESMTEMVQRLYNEFKDERYVGMYQMTLPTLMLRDPELIKQITVKDFDHFVDHRSITPDPAEPLWTKNLFALKGEQWRDMRSILTPSFTASKMRAMFILMEEAARQYVKFYLNKEQDVVELELKDSTTRFANDVIASCAFGVTVDSLREPENSFYLHGQQTTSFNGFWKMLKFLIYILAPKLAYALRISLFPQTTTHFFKKLVYDTVKLREEQNIVRPDMINLLMEARKGRLQYKVTSDQQEASFATVPEIDMDEKQDNQRLQLTDDDIVAQVLFFFSAGFDTISTAISFMCYELAVNPEIQERLLQEIDDTFKRSGGKLTYDILGQMKYMDMVLSETLRIVPPAALTDRVCIREYTIRPTKPTESPVRLKPGTVLWLPIAGIHHDIKIYPNPEKFDPERFSEHNKKHLNGYNYFPFGVGPRICIGSRFALMECKVLLFHLLCNFELTVIQKTPIPMKLVKGQFNPAIQGGCWVGLKRRQSLSKIVFKKLRDQLN